MQSVTYICGHLAAYGSHSHFHSHSPGTGVNHVPCPYGLGKYPIRGVEAAFYAAVKSFHANIAISGNFVLTTIKYASSHDKKGLKTISSNLNSIIHQPGSQADAALTPAQHSW